jgi:hypothetical protein
MTYGAPIGFSSLFFELSKTSMQHVPVLCTDSYLRTAAVSIFAQIVIKQFTRFNHRRRTVNLVFSRLLKTELFTPNQPNAGTSSTKNRVKRTGR